MKEDLLEKIGFGMPYQTTLLLLMISENSMKLLLGVK